MLNDLRIDNPDNDPRQLNIYLYASPSVLERVMRENFQSRNEHRARAAKAIAEFDRNFGGSST
jgi:hypothetical protein